MRRGLRGPGERGESNPYHQQNHDRDGVSREIQTESPRTAGAASPFSSLLPRALLLGSFLGLSRNACRGSGPVRAAALWPATAGAHTALRTRGGSKGHPAIWTHHLV